MPFNADLHIPEDAWASMSPGAQAAATAAGAQRASLARLPLLLELRGTLPAAEAARLGVTVLDEVGGDVSVGLFALPQLDGWVVDPPKSEWGRIEMWPSCVWRAHHHSQSWRLPAHPVHGSSGSRRP